MEPKDQNLAALESTLKNLKPGERLQITSSKLRHALGAKTEDAGVAAAHVVAKPHHCEFRYDREHGTGYFQRTK